MAQIIPKSITKQIMLINRMPIFRKHVNMRMKKEIEKIKQDTIQKFLKHSVTIELMNGVRGSNISGTLGDVTNLYSFIGFESGTDPIQPILDKLQSISFSFTLNRIGGFTYKINIPEAKDIFSVTPMPWASGRSWAKGIETGISGLGFYLRGNEEYSRSGFGIQAKRQIRKSSRFRNVSYISALINELKDKIKRLERQVL